MTRRKIKQVLYLMFLSVFFIQQGYCQQANAEDLLAKAMGPVGRDDNFAIHFEQMGWGLKSPEDILRQKAKVAGYFYFDKGAYEVNLVVMKMLCDNELLVTIDETSKQMIIDSIPKNMTAPDSIQKVQLIKMAGMDFNDGICENMGAGNWAGHACYKIKLSHKGEKGVYSFFWVDSKTNRLYAFADFHNGKYDVFVVKKIGTAPVGYNYKIKMPNKEVKKMYGYEVLDLRNFKK